MLASIKDLKQALKWDVGRHLSLFQGFLCPELTLTPKYTGQTTIIVKVTVVNNPKPRCVTTLA